MGFNTDGLRLFVLAAEMLNISAAGRRLGMAPAVSSAKLAKLEHALGAELLHRTTRKVSLSIEGVDFLPFAREMIAQEEAALAALGKGTANVSGTLRFAAPSTFAQLYIAPILPKFLDQHPDLTLDLHLSDVQFDLIEGSYDLALRNAPLLDTSLKGRKLADDQRILCAAPSYLAVHGTPQSPDELANHKLIAFRHLRPRPLRAADGETGEFSPGAAKSQLIIDDGLSQKHATLAGAGISLNSLWSVHEEITSGQLRRVLPDYEGDDGNALWLIYPKSNVLSPKVRVFMDFLIAEIGKTPPWEG
ncbi:LysR family transcriptional regulator [uncultured Tateyamaria sp.]|uniref:LysR family transcriptional regulator n=1 Tax=uncultured Tateyamaria sp. TaxID=455651 RepID=UPI00260B3441|nr:LysR family transcriptional regulator [uncultured Tateyamaria sp.]